MRDYSKIIDMPHHVSAKYPQMPAADRAAQFASFAALKGYGEAVEEVARFTDGKVELAEDKQAELDVKLGILRGVLHTQPEITVTYFLPDKVKSGGKYLTVTGRLEKIDGAGRSMIFTGGASVPVDCVTEITGPAIDGLYQAD